MTHRPLQSCAQAFADAGNPWLTERERREDFAHASAKPRRRAIPKPEFVEIARTANSESARTLQIREQLKIRQALLAEFGGSRTVGATVQRDLSSSSERNVRRIELQPVRRLPYVPQVYDAPPPLHSGWHLSKERRDIQTHAEEMTKMAARAQADYDRIRSS